VESQKHDTERIFARDAVKMALSMETRCLEFYRDSAKRNQDPSGKEVFERLTQEKEAHIAGLNAKLEEIIRQEKDLAHAPVFLHFDPSELEKLIPGLSKYEKTGEFRLDGKASIELALALNRGTVHFFEEYAKKFAETQGRQILLQFAAQEGNHFDLMQRRMQEMQSSSSED
jgi:rubrerythrin